MSDHLNERHIYITGIATILFIIVIWIITPVILYWKFPGYYNEATRGQFGDMYGVVSSLFSGFTIVGLVVTILLQRIDIRIARAAYNQQQTDAKLNTEALELTRQQIYFSKISVDNSVMELKVQNRNARYQKFDNTFFNLTGLFIRTLDKFSHKELLGDLDEMRKENREYAAQVAKLGSENLAEIEKSIGLKARELVKKYYPIMSSFNTINGWICKEKKLKKNREKYFALLFNFLSHEQRVLILINMAFAKQTPKSLKHYFSHLIVSIKIKSFGGLIQSKIENLITEVGHSEPSS